jgi:PPOX class probable FMN-dependent enzyme
MGMRPLIRLEELWIGSRRNFAVDISIPLLCFDTVGSAGTDGSPRGDDGSTVIALNEHTLEMPDWRGNNRLDSLRNIVEDGRVSLLFLIGGENFAVRVNGVARLSADDKLLGLFEKDGHTPKSVIVIKVVEIYSQCSRALMRSGLWSQTRPADLPLQVIC